MDARVVFRDDQLLVVFLRFAANGTIDEHAAAWDIDVICLEGAGWASVDRHAIEIQAGQQIAWPRHREHRLWTSGTPMLALVLERLGSQ